MQVAHEQHVAQPARAVHYGMPLDAGCEVSRPLTVLLPLFAMLLFVLPGARAARGGGRHAQRRLGRPPANAVPPRQPAPLPPAPAAPRRAEPGRRARDATTEPARHPRRHRPRRAKGRAARGVPEQPARVLELHAPRGAARRARAVPPAPAAHLAPRAEQPAEVARSRSCAPTRRVRAVAFAFLIVLRGSGFAVSAFRFPCD